MDLSQALSKSSGQSGASTWVLETALPIACLAFNITFHSGMRDIIIIEPEAPSRLQKKRVGNNNLFSFVGRTFPVTATGTVG
ncbi:hypothetical protein BJX61DRAFT_496481, partial [Aspergillus egyptiacus]